MQQQMLPVMKIPVEKKQKVLPMNLDILLHT